MDGWLGLACVVRSPLALLPADVAPPIMEASSPARRCAQRSTPSPPASRDRPSARSATAVFPTAGGEAVERLGVGCGITPDQAVRKALRARRRSGAKLAAVDGSSTGAAPLARSSSCQRPLSCLRSDELQA